MTLQELQAHAYKCIQNINMWQAELRATEQKIAQEMQKPKEENEQGPEQVEEKGNRRGKKNSKK